MGGIPIDGIPMDGIPMGGGTTIPGKGGNAPLAPSALGTSPGNGRGGDRSRSRLSGGGGGGEPPRRFPKGMLLEPVTFGPRP